MAQLSSGKKWLFRSIAAGAPILLGVVGVFLLVRGGVITFDSGTIYLQEPGHERTGHKYIYDPLLGWKNIPNWQATTNGRKLTINSKGLRCPEYAYAKPPGVTRVLVLGDSFTWGYGVGNDELFTAQLEKLLERQPGQYQVLNAGVSGWGTDQEYLFLKKEGFKYSPDIVVLAFFIINDPDNNHSSNQYALDKPIFLNTDLNLANVPVPKPGSGAAKIVANADKFELTAAIIAAMDKECKKRDCRFIVMKFGHFLFKDSKELQEENTTFLRFLKQRVRPPYLDLDEEFAARGLSKTDLAKGNEDGHWNAFGHRATARILFDFLKRGDLLEAAVR